MEALNVLEILIKATVIMEEIFHRLYQDHTFKLQQATLLFMP